MPTPLLPVGTPLRLKHSQEIRDVTMDIPGWLYDAIKEIGKKTNKTMVDMVQEAVFYYYVRDSDIPSCVEAAQFLPSLSDADLKWLRTRDKQLNDLLFNEIRLRLSKIDKHIRKLKTKKKLTAKDQLAMDEVNQFTPVPQIIKDWEAVTDRILRDPPLHLLATRYAYHLMYLIDWILRDGLLERLSRVVELEVPCGNSTHGVEAYKRLKTARNHLLEWGRTLGRDWAKGKNRTDYEGEEDDAGQSEKG